ncbi:PAS domain S-box protein [Nocardioides sp.]|uniref:hybrid sensor histidine kinase/response regulator n=1 Tax=Nocardioides sp. TaxID=35761 RepID=UPI002F42F14B
MNVPLGGTRPSVVLVDDSKEVRAVVHRLLQSAGFEIVGEGGDGDEAIILAFRNQPELLLLDTSMPKVDGIEALPAILALSPETKVVMFTGFEEPGLAARARELGASDYVEKSIRLEELPERLARALDAPRVQPSLNAGAGGTTYADSAHSVHRESADLQEQAVLNEHVQQFRELFDRAEIGMATLTSSGTIVRANRALASLMSCSPYDLVGVDYGRLTVGMGDELDRKLEDICTLGEDLTSFEHHLPAPPGQEHTRIVRATLAPIRDAKQQVLYVFAQVHDVTAQRTVESELRRSEENFRRLVTAVRDYAIYMLDADGVVISWNSGAQRIKGYTASEIVGQNFRVFYTPEDRQDGHPEHNLEMAMLQGSYAEEGWRVRKDGTRFWARATLTAVYDDAGKHVGYAKVTRDQSQQREHEEERRSFLEQRVHLLALTAHELRNPTAVIDGSAGALLATWDAMSTDEREGLLIGIRGSADRLRLLASDLSSAARSAVDTLPQRLETVSLVETLRTAAARAQAAGAGIKIVTEIAREGEFSGDPGRLAQALDNLLDNAVRHGTPPVGLIGAVDDVVRICVTDAGSGVPDELVPHLFERFAVIGPSGGTGLGLHLVREIARRHGGDVTYRAPAGNQPTTFEITIPRRHDAAT